MIAIQNNKLKTIVIVIAVWCFIFLQSITVISAGTQASTNTQINTILTDREYNYQIDNSQNSQNFKFINHLTEAVIIEINKEDTEISFKLKADCKKIIVAAI